MLNPSWNERGVATTPPEELSFITPEWQKLLTSNYDTVNKIYLVVFVQNFKSCDPYLWRHRYFLASTLSKMAILVYFLNLNNSFDTNGVTMKLCKCLDKPSNSLAKRVWWCHYVLRVFYRPEYKELKNSDFE